jgi:hypothetical protein
MEMAMRITLTAVLALALAANGVHMLFDPAGWYALVPGVPETGPLNPHFVRDIGCAYVVTGAAFAWLAIDERARPAALMAAMFLSLHALVHVADMIAGRAHAEHAAATFAAVFVPAALALWLALPSLPIWKGMPLLPWLLNRHIDAFERDYGYDASYIREMLDVDLGAVLALAKLQTLSDYRKDVPTAAWYAVKFVAARGEDCGPCTQLAITAAERDGVAADVLKALVAGDLRAMPDDVVLAYRFATASLAHDPAADELRAEIIKRWGKQALLSLALALASVRVYPALKYALGHGQTCSRLTVGGKPIPMLRQAA